VRKKDALLPFLHWGRVFHNLPAPILIEHATQRLEGVLARDGALVVATGKYTGRSPNDKFLVRDEVTCDHVWWGKHNPPMEPAVFDGLERRVAAHLQHRDLYVQDCYVGTDSAYRLPLRIISEVAWHSAFARNMFLPEDNPKKLRNFKPAFTLIDAMTFHADPALDGTRSEAFVALNFTKKLVLIGGTAYAGETKKAIFTVMNYLLPERGVLPMHCSANIGARGGSALFFGLSGTGKTTVSSDPHRRMIGDDEHGWTERGVFNFEGGCYAKVISLSAQDEPVIWNSIHRFGTILENVTIDPESRLIDLNDDSRTANTRGSYPISFIADAELSGRGGHPRNVIMLTCDAFGILPPVAKLTPQQAIYHFLSGYTAKVAGTERGIVKPQVTFSTCFGAPFMSRRPTVYADLLRERIHRHKVQCWLVNTGWTGGPYGVGRRMSIAHTRAMVSAALTGKLDRVELRADPIFKVLVPTSCPDVPAELLSPRSTWKDKRAYQAKAKRLAQLFTENFDIFQKMGCDDLCEAAPEP
jgi:phosphoenolpyruvate carboxykinase (ATP)